MEHIWCKYRKFHTNELNIICKVLNYADENSQYAPSFDYIKLLHFASLYTLCEIKLQIDVDDDGGDGKYSVSGSGCARTL